MKKQNEKQVYLPLSIEVCYLSIEENVLDSGVSGSVPGGAGDGGSGGSVDDENIGG